MKWGIALLLLGGPAWADVCIDTSPFTVNLSSAAYQAPTSTTTTKAVLLKNLFQASYDRDRNWLLWIQAVENYLQLQKMYDDVALKNDTLWRVINASAPTIVMPQP